MFRICASLHTAILITHTMLHTAMFTLHTIVNMSMLIMHGTQGAHHDAHCNAHRAHPPAHHSSTKLKLQEQRLVMQNRKGHFFYISVHKIGAMDV